jgi:hypothetical protein
VRGLDDIADLDRLFVRLGGSPIGPLENGHTGRGGSVPIRSAT